MNSLRKFAAIVPLVFSPAMFPQAQANDLASSATPALSFDVVSIKLNKSPNPHPNATFPPDGITIMDMAPFVIVMTAYNFTRENLIAGMPEWTKTERYDIQAK
jgi:hypothetical protein